MQKLELYFRPTCPYCMKVLTFIDENDITLELKDISADGAALEELLNVGGKQQVPCLFIDGAPMYESDEIIGFLKTL